MIRLLSLLKEAIEIYDWNTQFKEKFRHTYIFSTPSGLNYTVIFKGQDEDNNTVPITEAHIAYAVFNAKPTEKVKIDDPYLYTPSKGEVFNVMTTIMDITKEFVKEYPKIDTIAWASFSKESRQGETTTQRDNLYIRFFKNTFPGSIEGKSDTPDEEGNYPHYMFLKKS